MVGSRKGRFSYKQERELISMAANGATVSQIAAKYTTSVETVKRTAKRLNISIKEDRHEPAG